MTNTAEEQRLSAEAQRAEHANWKRWGPYLSERQWGTVREDYSPDSQSWDYLPHDHARSKAYRWGEDGLLGFCDRQCRLCFSIALWNGKDPILKERLYGLNGDEGNHGEDVKEEYFYLDSTPTHSYCKGLYKYPHAEYPYARLLQENRDRSRLDPEFELTDAGVFDEERYFDVGVEYAKAGPDDVLIRIKVTNHGPETAELDLLPTFWFRNTWAWGCEHEGCWPKPNIWKETDDRLYAKHVTLDRIHIGADSDSNGTEPKWLFTDNDTNKVRFPDAVSTSEFGKDAFHRLLIDGDDSAVRSDERGTKTAAHFHMQLDPGETREFHLRFVAESDAPAEMFGPEFNEIFEARGLEADEFYANRSAGLGSAESQVLRQAYAGLLWTKQFYHYVIEDWLDGDSN
ncbi:MAG: glucosidase, partial [Planctomycetaceae bacterium]